MSAEEKERLRNDSSSMFCKFKKYIVHAESLREFCENFHRLDKVGDFESDYESHKAELLNDGFTFIPASTSVTGRIVSYYGKL